MNRIVKIFAVVLIGILLAGCGKREYRDGMESLENGKYEEAIKSLEKAVEKKRSVGDACRGIGIAKWEIEDFEGALEAFEAGIDMGSSDYLQELKYNQIVVNEYLGNFSQAKSLMEAYLQSYPDDAKAKRENEFLQTR